MAGSAHEFATITETLNSTGDSAPACGDYGDATPLVGLILAAYADAGAEVAGEASLLSDVIQVCSSGMDSADAQQAVEVLQTGVDAP